MSGQEHSASNWAPAVLVEPLRIVIAEDSWFVAEFLRSELTDLGHFVVGTARTGDELISLVARERPDLALVDVRLAQNSDGFAAARDIQSRFGVPALAATAHLAAAEARAAGLLGILRKPYTTAALKAAVEEAAHWLQTPGSPKPFIWR